MWMKKISLCILLLVFTASLVRAQNSATQQQIDKLTGQIQDLLEVQAQQTKRIDALEKDLSETREKVNTPVVNDTASRDDLKKLAEQVQEIDHKRQDDRELILRQIESLGKAAAITPLPTHHTSAPRVVADETPTPPAVTPLPATPQKGYEYEVKQGDTLGLIIKAYHAQGVKVKKSQIIAANPKMNPEVLIPGKKIFIPDASAK
jgi:LysM repeat protein